MQRSILAISNNFFRILLVGGILLIATPDNKLSQSYSLMLQFADSSTWGVLYIFFGVAISIAIYNGSSAVYRLAMSAALFFFLLLAFIYGLSGYAPAGCSIYLNLAIDCFLVLNGAPIYGATTPQWNKHRLQMALCNSFFRIPFFAGVALAINTNPWNSSYTILLHTAPKWFWILLYFVAGLLPLITLLLGDFRAYKRSLMLGLFLFVFYAVLSFAYSSPYNAATYSNLAIDALLVMIGAPLYGFVLVRNGETIQQ